MSFNARLKYNQVPTAETDTTAVAAGTVVGDAAGNKVNLGRVDRSKAMSCVVVMKVKTSSLTLTPKVQKSYDGSTWYDCVQLNSAANVATAAGTGSVVTTTRSLEFLPPAGKFVRVVFVTGGATAHASDDKFEIVGYAYETDN